MIYNLINENLNNKLGETILFLADVEYQPWGQGRKREKIGEKFNENKLVKICTYEPIQNAL